MFLIKNTLSKECTYKTDYVEDTTLLIGLSASLGGVICLIIIVITVLIIVRKAQIRKKNKNAVHLVDILRLDYV